MEFVDAAECWHWNEATNEGAFLHTTVIAIDQDQKLYFAKVHDRQTNARSEQIQQWFEIPLEHIYPSLPADLSVFQGELNASIYHKKPRFSAYDCSPHLAESLLREATIYERLQQNKSPSIARCHGCIVSSGRIVGIALSMYDQTLDERMRQGFEHTQAVRWLDQIRQGLEVLHSKGLAHNDLNPWNVMVSNEDAVIIDFDSCCPLGEALLKCGTPDWADDSAMISATANDEYSLQKIAAVLGIPDKKFSQVPRPRPDYSLSGEAHSCSSIESLDYHSPQF
ncbi:hypothetical protein LTR13_011479 [Exophiala sideris]|nr:hypothetical protein LTR13_011479 [Exophiala sideris]KAK5175920.1 hypothetical protein LTR44_011521 [Eurotiomycetes sp. CCFEE 6388]